MNTRLNWFSVLTEKHILAIIKPLDRNKSYGWDNISTKMKMIKNELFTFCQSGFLPADSLALHNYLV